MYMAFMAPSRRATLLRGRAMPYQWLSLVAVIWLQSINGTNSNFPAYSSQLKEMMSISQVQLNNLAFANDAGKLFGWISGIAALYLPLWMVLLAGSFIGLLSYGLQYLFFSGQLHGADLSYGHVFLLTVLAGNSICWINTVCYAVVIAGFPSRSRQVAVGITTSYQGLSAKIYTDIVDAVAPASLRSAVSPSTSGRRANAYLLLSSVVPAIISAVTAPLVRNSCITEPVGEDGADDQGGSFLVLFAITIATGVYAVASSFEAVSTGIPTVYNVVGIGLLLMAPLIIPLTRIISQSRLGRWWAKRRMQIHDLTTSGLGAGGDNDHHLPRAESGLVATIKGDDQVQRQHQTSPHMSPPAEANNIIDLAMLESGDVVHALGIGTVREEVGVRAMLTRIDFWVYLYMYLFGATLGLVYLNNLGQITESRGFSRTSSLVSLASAFGFFGRLLPSLLDFLLSRRKYAISRPACVVALMAPMTGAFFMLLSFSDLCLYISTAVIGVCTGAITSISVSITTELFGTKNFSVNHNVLVANIPVGSFAFGYLAAVLYRRAANGDGKCVGTECYRVSFIIWGCLCLLGTSLALLLYARSRNFYSRRSTRTSQDVEI